MTFLRITHKMQRTVKCSPYIGFSKFICGLKGGQMAFLRITRKMQRTANGRPYIGLPDENQYNKAVIRAEMLCVSERFRN